MGKIIELFSEERRRALCATSGRGEPPPPAYCTPGLNALLGRSSPGVVDSQSYANSVCASATKAVRFFTPSLL
jgi:hypothetical protein